MESDPRLKEHDYSCPLPASGRSDTMDDLFLNSFVPLQNDPQLEDLMEHVQQDKHIRFYFQGEQEICDTFWLDEILNGDNPLGFANDSSPQMIPSPSGSDEGYKSGEGMSPPSAPESSEGSPGMAGDPSLLDGIPTLDELLACDAGLPGDLGDLSSFLDSIPPPAIPDQQNVATLGCATSVLKGTPVSSTPASPQSTPNECSVPTVATSEKELEAAKEQADPRLSGPTAFMANSVCWQYGQLTLTMEEKTVLKAEGLPIPTSLPLTPDEAKSIKQVRRKIKNKISAQESRRKRKNYIDSLEKQLSASASMNQQLMERLAVLEKKNSTLESETTALRKEIFSVKSLVGQRPVASHKTLMVLVFAFALFFPFFTTPHFSMPWSKSSLPTGVSPAFAEPDVLDLSMSDQPFDYSSVEQPFDYSSRSFRSRTLMQFIEGEASQPCPPINGTSIAGTSGSCNAPVKAVQGAHDGAQPVSHSISPPLHQTVQVLVAAAIQSLPLRNHTLNSTLVA